MSDARALPFLIFCDALGTNRGNVVDPATAKSTVFDYQSQRLSELEDDAPVMSAPGECRLFLTMVEPTRFATRQASGALSRLAAYRPFAEIRALGLNDCY